MANLSELRLDRTKVTDAGLARLKPLGRLSTLGLSWTRVSDSGLVDLRGVKNLSLVDLSHTRVSEAGVQSLSRLMPRLSVEDLAPSGTISRKLTR